MKGPTEYRGGSLDRCRFAIAYIHYARRLIMDWLDDEAVLNQQGRLESVCERKFEEMASEIRNTQNTVSELNWHPCGDCIDCIAGLCERVLYQDPSEMRPGYVPPHLD